MDSASNRNECQGHFLGVKARPGAYGWQSCHVQVPMFRKFWRPQPPEASGPIQSCAGELYFYHNIFRHMLTDTKNGCPSCCGTMSKLVPPTTEPKWCLTAEDFSILRWISQYISGIYSRRRNNLQCSRTGVFRPDVLPRLLLNKSIQDPKDNEKIQWSTCQGDSSGLEDGIPWQSWCLCRVYLAGACMQHVAILIQLYLAQQSSVTYWA